MSAKSYVFTSESVTEGHPDKMCDGISDSVLDAFLAQDPMSRVACETLVTTGLVVIAGEITSKGIVNFSDIAREKIRKIGFVGSETGFDANTCAVMVSVGKQSPDIAQGVDERKAEGKATAEQGAGDQGMMFGYACNETKELMPAPITWAHALSSQLTKARKTGKLKFLRPDGKSQVSVRYENGVPVGIANIVVSSQHSPDVSTKDLRAGILEEVIKKVIPAKFIPTGKNDILINPTGKFVVGGPMGDAGLTGRKIIVDTYGGMGRHGGGAFSGKDPTKVDRSAAYMARYVAKNIVAAGLADRCEVQLAYAIGYPEPVSVLVDTFGTCKVDESKLAKAVRAVFGLKPRQIIEQLNLRRPVFEATSAYGHFGRNSAKDLEGFTWERTDKVEALKAAL
jgi:S-adenosylmethionine synthetase